MGLFAMSDDATVFVMSDWTVGDSGTALASVGKISWLGGGVVVV
jgi:hypothetical protein